MYNTLLWSFCFHCRFFHYSHYNAKCKGDLHLFFCCIQQVSILHFVYVFLTNKPLLGIFACFAAPILKKSLVKNHTTHLLQKDCHLNYDKLLRWYWTEFQHTWLAVIVMPVLVTFIWCCIIFLTFKWERPHNSYILPQAFPLSWNFTAFSFLKFVVINS